MFEYVMGGFVYDGNLNNFSYDYKIINGISLLSQHYTSKENMSKRLFSTNYNHRVNISNVFTQHFVDDEFPALLLLQQLMNYMGTF